ncbi:MAG TPA: lipid A biosynthesis acyltransferase [Burkholderiaceae bacterium]|nr:lipid A biosynthesis acyltransferase [Burkholderiaceae bacterium]
MLSRLAIAAVEATHTWSPRARARLAAVLGALLWWLVVPRRRVLLANLRACFPKMPEGERRRIGRQCFRNLTRAFIDHGVLARGSKEEVSRFVRLAGGEHLHDPANRPLILLAPHFAGLNAGAVRLSVETQGVSIYARQRNAEWDRWLHALRSRFIPPELIERSGFDLRAAIRALQRGLPFYYLPDQDYGRRHAIFVPFFGVPAATIPMVSRLAQMAGAKVVMTVTEMTDDGYVLHLEPPWSDFPSGDLQADTLRMNREIEAWVRRLPDQYLWTHKRFKTRPEGAEAIY